MTLPHESYDALMNDADAHETLRDLMLMLNADALAPLNDDDAIAALDADALAFDDARSTLAHLNNLISNDYRDSLTMIALALSLCPLHFCDYAICFDDDDPACAPIRTIHPSHDS